MELRFLKFLRMEITMKSKNDIDITIGGKTFTLSGVESEDYLREVAAYLNEKIRGFSDDASYWRLPNDMRNVMLQLNLADDFFKEHSRAAALEAQVQEMEEQRARVDSELESAQKSAGEAAARITRLEADAAGLRDKVQRASAAENSATKRFGAEKSRAGKLEEELDALRRSKAESDKAVQRLKDELARTREDLSQELGRTKTDLEQKLSDSESRRKKEVGDLQQQRKKEVKELQELREKDVKNLQAQRQQEVQEILGRHEKEIREKEASSAKTLREREDSLRKELAKTRKDLTQKLEAQKKEANQYKDDLARAEAEIAKLRSGLTAARAGEEEANKKLSVLEKEFDDRLKTGTEKYIARARDAEQDLAKTQEELAVLQERENEHMQAAARVRGTMQEIVSQYGRFGKSVEEAADQMRALG